MKKFLLLTAIACTAAVSAVAPAMAGTSTGTITIGAGTAALCTAPTATSVALGNYDGTAAVSGTTSVVFRCTNTTLATVTLLSNSVGGTNLAGKLSDAVTPTSTPINYTFSGDGLTAQGTGLSAAINDISTPVTVNVAGGQNPAPGTYSDTIKITVTY
jgi:spore coat protein U-like protein